MFGCPSVQFNNNSSRKNLIIQGEDKLFGFTNVIKNFCLILLPICIIFREAQESEEFLVTEVQRASEETL